MAKRAAPSSAPPPSSNSRSSRSASRPETTWGRPTTRKAPARGQAADAPTKTQLAAAGARKAIEGQEHEFTGLGFIAAGVLLGLSVYLKVAGVLGDAIAKALGWTTGLARYALPIICVAVGVSLIRRTASENRTRLVFGWALVAVAMLGLMHVARGPRHFSSDIRDLERAGGVIGAVIGAPLRTLLADAGAVVVLLAVLAGGMMLVVRATLREVVATFAAGIRHLSRPLGRAARKAYGEVSTLASERTGELPPPRLYDAASDELPPPAGALAPPGPSSKPRKAKPPSPKVFDDPDIGTLAAGPVAQPELDLGPGAQKGVWKLPPLSFLNRSSAQTIDMVEVRARGQQLVDALASHSVETKYIGEQVGPTVTRYELELGEGVKVAQVTSLQRDIAYATAATDVRILAPIPGKRAIGIEVPNHHRELVALGDNLASAEAKAATHPLDVAIGKDIAGRSVFLNLATTPHLLIAGATGAGKSSGINCIITSMLMRTTPDQVRLILIDPKQVEMGQYNRLPHLLTQPVTNPKKAANALSWAVKEMERRYDLLFEVGFRDITGYNAAYDRGELQADALAAHAAELASESGDEPSIVPAVPVTTFERLPYIVVVVDELNDLMMVAARDVEESITRIAQKARAVGIHLIVATQRPSVNVITGVIKANVPARMAFAVSSLTDSRVILDQPGAEKLIGKGDMLLLPGNSSVAQRIQGCFVTEEEVRKVVAHWRRQAPEVTYVSGVEGEEAGAGSGSGGYATGGDDDEDEVLLRQAMDLIVRSQLGSTSMLQRKLKVGFARAGRLMDLLEQRGVVGPSEGSKARAVLMTVEELELLQEAGREL